MHDLTFKLVCFFINKPKYKKIWPAKIPLKVEIKLVNFISVARDGRFHFFKKIVSL